MAETEGEVVKVISRRLLPVLAAWEKHWEGTPFSRESKPSVQSLRMSYREGGSNPNEASQTLADFPHPPLNLKATRAQLEASLDRNPAG
jgi:hypothetical protein